MADITKKVWPELFAESKRWRAHVRLADFRCRAGDRLVLAEWNPKTKLFTGRKFARRIRRVTRLKLAKFYKLADIKKYGILIIET
jgi:hypothetical protein